MSNPYFRFKQFTVFHDKCAMKVGTDGVLLGSWADASCCKKILDVGSGTGLISLMLAQRFPAAEIDAIEIDKNAYLQAVENCDNSVWENRIHVFEGSFPEFFDASSNKYDLIVSNPPYFSKSLLPPKTNRQLARHTDNGLTPEKLIIGAKKLLNDTGKIALILPFTLENEFSNILLKHQLYLSKYLLVKPTPSSVPKRILAEVTLQKSGECISDELIIEMERHVYSPLFKQLTQDFYLEKKSDFHKTF